MGKYQEALNNLEFIIKSYGSSKYADDIKLLQNLIDDYQRINIDAKTKAQKILSDLPLYGIMYYQLEDWLTDCIEGKFREMPLGTEAEFLKGALRLEIKDYLEYKDNNITLTPNDVTSVQYTDEDVENILDIILDDFNNNALNTEFIQDMCTHYTLNKDKHTIHEWMDVHAKYIKLRYQTNNSLAVAMEYNNDMSIITVNFTDYRYPGFEYAFVDTNNFPGIDTYLQMIGLAESTGEHESSGFCVYPLLKFNINKLIEGEK